MKLKILAKFDAYNCMFESYMVAANKMHDLTTKQYYLNSLPCGLGAWAQDYIIRKENQKLDDVSFPTLRRLIRYKLEKQCLLGALQLNKDVTQNTAKRDHKSFCGGRRNQRFDV